MNATTEKRPREYAAEIIKLKTRAERQSALECVPTHLRGMVSDHVESVFMRRAGNSRP